MTKGVKKIQYKCENILQINKKTKYQYNPIKGDYNFMGGGYNGKDPFLQVTCYM